VPQSRGWVSAQIYSAKNEKKQVSEPPAFGPPIVSQVRKYSRIRQRARRCRVSVTRPGRPASPRSTASAPATFSEAVTETPAGSPPVGLRARPEDRGSRLRRLTRLLRRAPANGGGCYDPRFGQTWWRTTTTGSGTSPAGEGASPGPACPPGQPDSSPLSVFRAPQYLPAAPGAAPGRCCFHWDRNPRRRGQRRAHLGCNFRAHRDS
jgi:hypothetical protein